MQMDTQMIFGNEKEFIHLYNLIHSIDNIYGVITGKCTGIASILFLAIDENKRFAIKDAVYEDRLAVFNYIKPEDVCEDFMSQTIEQCALKSIHSIINLLVNYPKKSKYVNKISSISDLESYIVRKYEQVYA